MSIFSDQIGKKCSPISINVRGYAKEQSISKMIKPNTIQNISIVYYDIKVINSKIYQIEKRGKTK